MKKNSTTFILKSLFLLGLLTAAASLSLEREFTLKGSTDYDQLGYPVSSGGDINGDGFDDLVVGCASKNAVYVVYGGATVSLDSIDLSSTPLNPLATGFIIKKNPSQDLWNPSINIAGDINRDGYNDIIIGAPMISTVIVVYGGPTVTMVNIDLSTMALDPATTGFMIKGIDYSQFGSSVSTGDVDRDGYDDIIIGAFDEGATKGAVHVVYGREKSSMSNLDLSLTPLNPYVTGFSIFAESQWDYLGNAVASGDINNDGYDDLVIGAPLKNGTGVIYVVYGRQRFNLMNLNLSITTLDPMTQGFMIVRDSYTSAYSALSIADVDGDGFDDIIVGAPFIMTDLEFVSVIYGGPTSMMSNLNLAETPLNPATTGFQIKGRTPRDSFGHSVSSAGDLNGDGYEDILIGAPRRNTLTGEVYVIYGGPRSGLSNIDLSSSPTNQSFSVAGNPLSEFGFSVSSGDVNNDGFPELIIGALWENNSRGAAHVLFYSKPPVVQCPDNCKTCSGSICQECSSGFILQNSLCVPCPANCESCSDSASCEVCSYPYFLYQGQCIFDCPSQTFRANGSCQNCPSNCDTCSDSASCEVCSYPYLLYQGQCILDCPSSTFMSNGTCLDCPINCKACSDPSVCTACSAPYFLFQGQCISNCPGQTVAINGTCQNCPSHCGSCSDPSVCTACSAPYFLYQGQCVLNCPPKTFRADKTCRGCPSNCDACSNSASCQVCSYPYFLYQGQCILNCPSKTFRANGTCQNCPSNCSTCSDSTSCQVCSYPYFLYQGQCVSNCPLSTIGINGTCQESCPSHCKTCTPSSACTSCFAGSFLYQNQCVQSCPPKTFGSNGVCLSCPSPCDNCSNSSVCTSCPPPFFLYQGQCILNCPLKTVAINGVCEDCPSYCEVCSSPTSCQVCSSPYL